MNYTFTDEDIKLVERLIEIKNRGYYADGKQVTDAYNRILHKNRATTNCGACLKQMVSELEGALNHFKALEAKKEAELNTVKEDENKAVTEAGNDEIKARMAKVRAAKKNNKK